MWKSSVRAVVRAVLIAACTGAGGGVAVNAQDIVVDNWSAPTHASAVSQTWFPSPSVELIAIQPSRVVDTRLANDALRGPILTGGVASTFPLPTGTCGTFRSAIAYSLNVTVIPPSTDTYLGYVTIWPTGSTAPFVSTLNFLPGQVVANAAIVPAGTDGSVDVEPNENTHLVLDVDGYFVTCGDLGNNNAGIGKAASPSAEAAATTRPSAPGAWAPTTSAFKTRQLSRAISTIQTRAWGTRQSGSTAWSGTPRGASTGPSGIPASFGTRQQPETPPWVMARMSGRGTSSTRP
jgi:hypothetical protein